jgi:hypothetical protein
MVSTSQNTSPVPHQPLLMNLLHIPASSNTNYLTSILSLVLCRLYYLLPKFENSQHLARYPMIRPVQRSSPEQPFSSVFDEFSFIFIDFFDISQSFYIPFTSIFTFRATITPFQRFQPEDFDICSLAMRLPCDDLCIW